MHKEDLMTPVERQKALQNHRSVDRLPIGIIFSSASAQLLLSDAERRGEKAAVLAAAKIKIYEAFGVDGLEVFYGLNTFAKVYGAVMSEPEIGEPAVLQHPMKSLAEIEMVDPDDFSMVGEDNAAACFDALRMIQEKVGDEVPCGMGFPGPLTVASSLLGAEKLLRALHREPEQLHKLLQRINAALIKMAREFLREDIPVSISDPVASGTMISPRQFDNFVKPYAKEFVAACKEIRPYGVGCHICGDTTKILRNMVDCGYSSLSLDNRVDLAVAKEAVGSLVPISGNVPPIEIMTLGTPEQVAEAVKECFRKAGHSPCGFTINTGCDCSPYTPMANALAYIKAARRCAKYPYSDENLSW